MSYYLVAEITFKNEDWWGEYLKGNTPLIKKHGGRVLARTHKFEKLSPGDKPTVMVIIEWPNPEAAKAFATDPDYAPYEKLRLEGTASSEAFMVLGEDEVDNF
jgi:uncharacterized protein (DUF1330 family)